MLQRVKEHQLNHFKSCLDSTAKNKHVLSSKQDPLSICQPLNSAISAAYVRQAAFRIPRSQPNFSPTSD